MKLKSKVNGYEVELINDHLICNNISEPMVIINNMIYAYMAFTEFFTVNDNDIVINKDDTGNELFCMIVKFSELKAIYKELRDKPKVHHLKANNIEIK